ncbi:MAG: hypothetical protein KDB07_11680, partial [Planctomycetes bacterium]|nr:hypothetical protein [Planctomycetota bacterium]
MNGNPVNYVDPDGRFIFTTILVGAIIYAAFNEGMEYGQKLKDARGNASKAWRDYKNDFSASRVAVNLAKVAYISALDAFSGRALSGLGLERIGVMGVYGVTSIAEGYT